MNSDCLHGSGQLHAAIPSGAYLNFSEIHEYYHDDYGVLPTASSSMRKVWEKKTSMDWIDWIGDFFLVSTVNQPNQGTLKEWQIVYNINKKLFSSTKILEMIIRIYNKIHTSTYSTQEQSRTASQAFCIGVYHLGLETTEVKLKEVYAVPLMYLWLTKYTYYK